jgi:hypothetical protein
MDEAHFTDSVAGLGTSYTIGFFLSGEGKEKFCPPMARILLNGKVMDIF